MVAGLAFRGDMRPEGHKQRPTWQQHHVVAPSHETPVVCDATCAAWLVQAQAPGRQTRVHICAGTTAAAHGRFARPCGHCSMRPDTVRRAYCIVLILGTRTSYVWTCTRTRSGERSAHVAAVAMAMVHTVRYRVSRVWFLGIRCFAERDLPRRPHAAAFRRRPLERCPNAAPAIPGAAMKLQQLPEVSSLQTRETETMPHAKYNEEHSNTPCGG